MFLLSIQRVILLLLPLKRGALNTLPPIRGVFAILLLCGMLLLLLLPERGAVFVLLLLPPVRGAVFVLLLLLLTEERVFKTFSNLLRPVLFLLLPQARGTCAWLSNLL
jgi:hypothetical protein